MAVINRQKDLKESKISPELFAKAIQSLDLSAISDPVKKEYSL